MFESGCIFCKIINNELPATILYEDEKTMAFKDLYPKAPLHILVIPKIHIEGATFLDGELAKEYLPAIWDTVHKVVDILGIREKGFRLIVNSGLEGGQEVFHLHFHVLGGKKLGFTKI